MNETSRRNVIGVAAAGVVGTAGALALSGGSASARTGGASAVTEPVVAYIEDPTSGVLNLMVGDREVVVRDQDLVTRLLNAAGGR